MSSQKREVASLNTAKQFSDFVNSHKYVVVKVTADWCGPCREVDKEMIKILQSNDQVAFRKINIVAWHRDVAKKYLQNASGLPYLKIYSKKGKRIGEVAGLDLKKLNKIITKGSKE